MLNHDASRHFPGPRIARAAIAAAVLLAGSVHPTDAASDVYAAFKRSGAIVSEEPIVTLRVPGGLYAVVAKINIDQDDTTGWVTAVCTLQAARDFDRAVSRLQDSSVFSVDNDTVRLQLVTVLPAGVPNDIKLSCKFEAFESSLLSFRFAKITALRLDGTRCQKRSPADCLPD